MRQKSVRCSYVPKLDNFRERILKGPWFCGLISHDNYEAAQGQKMLCPSPAPNGAQTERGDTKGYTKWDIRPSWLCRAPAVSCLVFCEMVYIFLVISKYLHGLFSKMNRLRKDVVHFLVTRMWFDLDWLGHQSARSRAAVQILYSLFRNWNIAQATIDGCCNSLGSVIIVPVLNIIQLFIICTQKIRVGGGPFRRSRHPIRKSATCPRIAVVTSFRRVWCSFAVEGITEERW